MKPRLIWRLFLLAGLVAALAYRLIGARVDETGVLREPFFLVPLSYGIIAIGAIGLLLSWWRARAPR